MNKDLEKALQIRYTKLHFVIRFISDCKLPVNKVSALRGGMGEMLLRANCISDRQCEKCGFESECLVQRTMYSRYEMIPEGLSVEQGDSIGYVIECENYHTHFEEGEILKFNLILFGKTLVYFSQYMQAFYALGQNGIGKDKAKFVIDKVTNVKGVDILDGSNVYMQNYAIYTLADYVEHRLVQMEEMPNTIEFKSPVTIKYQKEFIDKLDINAIVAAVKRRIYMLDCFEGIDTDVIHDCEVSIPDCIDEIHEKIEVPRYSSRRDTKMTLKGIKGIITVDNIDESLLGLLLAAEITHIGKNTSFGFGRMVVR